MDSAPKTTSKKTSNAESDPRSSVLDKDEIAMKQLMEYFMEAKPNDLLQQSKCLSSAVNFINYQSIRESINRLQPVMLVEKDNSAIIAFKKEPKGPKSLSKQD